ncbi:epidermal growth factor receptor kinase substrate 8-like isoform X2 [Phlebotomus papatasi]|uniref:epidermal growth factor receptor kinase substrate 8-like isoform X2 n=1 Tax=Phlebotomus papatasi TaxID=29031 RepID=UPI0024833099|nr:epidermal growth factor receptor kinase substrate 8-like isoform X2 [Phlebotomus papatasi]XP_055705251.1 epidermal growth factor receptor kinase substrate 8-like isoform X2 [Phlebotomus papatasi]
MAHYSNGGYSGDEHDSRSDSRPGSDLGDKPTYLLEHLATFTVNQESGIVYPADGMRRLLQLEKTTGIWSQKMQLCLDKQWILIMDYESGNIIEKFPASLIQEPTAFTSNDPMEMYNNILVFIVGNGGNSSRSEMHIFQCQSISAVHLVEDLKMLRSGKVVLQHRETLPTPPIAKSNTRSFNSASYHDHQHHSQDTDSEFGVSGGERATLAAGHDPETSSTSSEKYERDVTVLNHCFDDIEKFIARLQHAAAATRELERRRRNRKSKKRDPGEGLLTLRTRPPHEKEFIDIFAKFKLSFNLLAKLKAHIHDPNAPELVHFLFTPLALIVDASHDTYYDPNLPARVINPLLTREAINLLINCVTSKETELWRSLGDAWIISRDQWKGHTGSYHPVFFDGWSPDYPVVEELENIATGSGKRQIDTHQLHYASGGVGDFDYDPQTPMEKYSGAPASPGLRDISARSDISVDSIERNGAAAAAAISAAVAGHDSNGTDAWVDELQAQGAKIVQVTYPRTANNDKELTVVRGEYLEVLDDSRKWWKARNSRGQVAHVPHTIVTPINYSDNDVFNNPLYNQNRSTMGGNSQEMERFSSPPNESGNSGMPVPGSADWIRNKHLARQSMGMQNGQEEMQEELRQVLTLFREKRRGLEIMKTPEIFIQQSSTSAEVEKWLKAKGFSDNVVKKLHGINGNELFALKRHTLEEYCGPDEGKRLASQITVQRNVSGYKTARSSELQAILAKARQKTEQKAEAKEVAAESN